MAESDKKDEPVSTPGPHFTGETTETRPTSQVDLEERLARDFKTSNPLNPATETDDPVVDPAQVYAPYKVEDNDTSAYVGVSPEYMTYANDTEKPLAAEEGPEADAEELLLKGSAVGKDADPESNETLGGGSNGELLYPASSGENWQSEVVDREAVHKEAAKLAEDANKDADGSTPNKAPAPKTGGDQLVSSAESVKKDDNKPAAKRAESSDQK